MSTHDLRDPMAQVVLLNTIVLDESLMNSLR